jgi:hypothetical protein
MITWAPQLMDGRQAHKDCSLTAVTQQIVILVKPCLLVDYHASRVIILRKWDPSIQGAFLGIRYHRKLPTGGVNSRGPPRGWKDMFLVDCNDAAIHPVHCRCGFCSRARYPQ